MGISDAFGAALWGIDYGMQMAYSNFSGALFHVGGQNVYYNPFTRMYPFFLSSLVLLIDYQQRLRQIKAPSGNGRSDLYTTQR